MKEEIVSDVLEISKRYLVELIEFADAVREYGKETGLTETPDEVLMRCAVANEAVIAVAELAGKMA